MGGTGNCVVIKSPVFKSKKPDNLVATQYVPSTRHSCAMYPAAASSWAARVSVNIKLRCSAVSRIFSSSSATRSGISTSGGVQSFGSNVALFNNLSKPLIWSLLSSIVCVTISQVTVSFSTEVSMIAVLDDLTRVTNNRADFVVEGNDIEEIMAAATSNLVIQKAAEKGLNRPGVSNASGPYPVDAEGKTDDELLLGKRGPVTGYRRDFVILAGL